MAHHLTTYDKFECKKKNKKDDALLYRVPRCLVVTALFLMS